MPIYVKEAIDQYIPVRESILSEYGDNSGGNLLVKPTRRIGFPVNPMDISNMVLRLKQRSGVNFTCHSLRRLFATTVNSVADLETLRQLMRHSSIEVTFKCYLNARPEVKNKALDEANEVLFGDPGWIVID
jgi:integrase